MKPCALCKLEKPLRNSHIVPEFMYQDFYDSKHKFFALSRTASEKKRDFQKGIREKLLCDDCEGLLNCFETYAAGIFYGNGKHPFKMKRDGGLVYFEQLDYNKLKLFFMSLLWRFGVTSVEELKGAELGEKHKEKLRGMIQNKNPGEPLHYPCMITAVMLNGKHLADFTVPPMCAKIDAHHVWQFVVAGFLFTFFVSSHPVTSVLKHTFLKKDGTMILQIQEIRGIDFLWKFFNELGEAQKLRKGLTKA